MKFSYQQQEARYQRLRSLGRAVDYAGESFDNFDLRPFLEEVLPGLTFSTDHPRALEYGTGTGPGACFLSARGFQVDAIDISPTAIDLARKFAAQRSLRIHYEVQDICHLRGRQERYELVVDSFCLHRLITDEQRRNALAVVRSVLIPKGYYVIGTVIFQNARSLSEDEKYDETTGILFRQLGADSQGYEDAVQRSGVWYAPRARHVDPKVLESELVQAGFQVLRQDGGKVLCGTA